MVPKKRFVRMVLAAWFVVSVGATGSASAATIAITPEYWRPGVSGETKGSTDVKLKDDLGLGKIDLLNIKLTYKSDCGLQYFVENEEPAFKATKSLPRSFSFNGGNYIAGDNATSELAVKHFKVGIRNEKKTSGGLLSTTYSFNHNTIKTGIENITQGFKQTRENTSNSFGLGFGWESINAAGVNFFAEATVLSIGSNGGYNDYKVGIKSKIGKQYDLCVGYKGERIETGKDKNSDYTKADLKGLFVTIDSRF